LFDENKFDLADRSKATFDGLREKLRLLESAGVSAVPSSPPAPPAPPVPPASPAGTGVSDRRIQNHQQEQMEAIQKKQEEELAAQAALTNQVDLLFADILRLKALGSENGGQVDPKYKLTCTEVAENEFISSDPKLREYVNHLQKCFNDAFLASSIMASGHFKLESTKSSFFLNMLSSLATNVPLASGLLSAAACAIDTTSGANKTADFQALAAINPTGNPVTMGIVSEAVSRDFCLNFHSEIVQGTFEKDKSTIDRLRSFFQEAAKRISGGDKICRGVFGPHLSNVQIVATDHAVMAISFIMSFTPVELSAALQEVYNDRKAFSQRLLTHVMTKYHSSGAKVVTIDAIQPNSGSGGGSREGGGGGGGGGGFEIAATSSEVEILKKELQKANEKAVAADKKAKEAAKEAKETRRILDAFVDVTGVGGGGQVSAAVRTKDGKVEVSVVSPALDQKVDGVALVASEISDRQDEVDNRVHNMERQFSEMRKEKKNRRCRCTLS